jgi:hypothetical protein
VLNNPNKLKTYRWAATCLTLIVLLSFSGICVAAQSNKTPEGRVKNFYSWYLKSINDGQDPAKKRSVLTSHLSARLGKWFYSKAGQGLEADYFISSQEWNEAWADNIIILELEIGRTKAAVNVTLGSPKRDWDMPLKISLIKEGGTWKIDRVKGR